MTASAAPVPPSPTPTTDSQPCARRRDAARTRRLLLDAALRRFADDGYGTTTLRDIADDAGVNVALIGRYFDSKEGLFEACLVAASDEFRRTAGVVPGDRIPDLIAAQAAGLSTREHPSSILLLLPPPAHLVQTHGDERAEQIRVGVLGGFAERLAATAGWRPDHPDGDQMLLRAQLVLATIIGTMLLRPSLRIEPLLSATADDLTGPLRDMVNALLSPER